MISNIRCCHRCEKFLPYPSNLYMSRYDGFCREHEEDVDVAYCCIFYKEKNNERKTRYPLEEMD